MFDKLRNYSKYIVYIVVVSFAVGGGFMGYGAFSGGDQSPADQESMNIVAEVEGEEISRHRLNELQQNYARQTADFTRAQNLSFQHGILSSLIDENLLMQKAEQIETDTEVSPEEIDEVIDNILTQNNMEMEELEQMLAQQDMSISQLQENIRRSLEQQKMMEGAMDHIQAEAEVTEAEVEEVYREEYEDDEDEAERSEEEVKEEIREDLMAEREDEVLDQWLTEAREEAEIEIKDPVMRAMDLFENEEFAAAAEEFSEAREMSRDPAVDIYYARSYQELGEAEEAYSVLESAIDVHPEEWEIYYEFGEIYAENDEEELALEKYKEASELAGRNLMARYRLSNAFTRLEESELAQEEMDQFIELQEERQEIRPEQEAMDEEEMEEIDPDEIEVSPGEDEQVE